MTILTASTHGKGDAYLRNGSIRKINYLIFNLLEEENEVMIEVSNDRYGVLSGYMSVPTETAVNLSKQLLKHQANKQDGYVITLSPSDMKAVMIAVSDNEAAFGASPQATGKGYERQSELYGCLFEELQAQTGIKSSDLGELAWD